MINTVLMTTDAVGGVWYYTTALAGGLAKEGIAVHVAVLGGGFSEHQRQELFDAGASSVHSGDFKLEWMEDPWDDVLASGQWLLALADELGPDVIHLNGYSHACLAWTKPRIIVAHSCVLSWWWAVYGCKAPAKYERYQREVAKGLESADSVIAPSRNMLHSLRRWYDYRGGRVIYNGVTSASTGELKQHFALCAGRVWDQAKNLGLVQELSSDSPIDILVAGSITRPDGTTSPVLAELVEGRVKYLGSVSHGELLALMARAVMFIAPVLYEPFGLAIVEAAQAGCALVLGDIGTMRELWDGAALFVDPHCAGDLLATIDSLLRNDDLLQELGRAAAQRAECFGIDGMVAEYLDEYETLVGPGGGE